MLVYHAGFILLSAASTKRVLYMMPLFPPASLLTAVFIEETLTKRALSGFERFFIYLFGAFFLAVGVAITPFTLYASRKYGFDVSISLIGALLLLSAAAVFFSWRALTVRAKNIGRFWAFSGVSVFALLLFLLTCVFPILDRYKSFVPFCNVVSASVPPGASLYAYKPDETLRGAIPFYTGRSPRGAGPVQPDAVDEQWKGRIRRDQGHTRPARGGASRCGKARRRLPRLKPPSRAFEGNRLNRASCLFEQHVFGQPCGSRLQPFQEDSHPVAAVPSLRCIGVVTDVLVRLDGGLDAHALRRSGRLIGLFSVHVSGCLIIARRPQARTGYAW